MKTVAIKDHITKKVTAALSHESVFVSAAIVATIFAAFFADAVVSRQNDVNAFKREQETLNEIGAFTRDVDSLTAFAREFREINPDYVGWLKIDGTDIDYPVVRGDDNEKYLNTTFRGANNPMGALFMDYRVDDNSPHIIIYGHDARHWIDGYFMFGGLKKFISDEYLARHPTITWIENDTLFDYEIFSARLTNIYDPAYNLGFGVQNSFQEFLSRNNAPQDARRIITLSTCYGNFPLMRMIVQGALKSVVPIATNKRSDGIWEIITP